MPLIHMSLHPCAGERKVVHVAGVTVHRAHASMNDMADIQNFAVQYRVDYVAASQVS